MLTAVAIGLNTNASNPQKLARQNKEHSRQNQEPAPAPQRHSKYPKSSVSERPSTSMNKMV